MYLVGGPRKYSDYSACVCVMNVCINKKRPNSYDTILWNENYEADLFSEIGAYISRF